MFAQNEMLSVLRHRWAALMPRQQSQIKFLLVIIVLFVSYQWIWSPFLQAERQARQHLIEAQAQWDWLNQQVPKIQIQQAQTKLLLTEAQLMAELQQSLRQQDLMAQMETIRPINEGIQVVFTKVDTPRFFDWLSALENQGLVADRLQLEPIEVGAVKVTLSYKVAL